MAVAGVEHVHVDLKQGTAMVSGGDVLTLGALVQALIGEGYGVTSEAEASTDPSTITSAASFAPLLIAVALIGAGSLASGGADGFMARFMGGFFLVFGGLKLLDLRGFVSAYAMYDLLAARVSACASAPTGGCTPSWRSVSDSRTSRCRARPTCTWRRWGSWRFLRWG